MLHAVTDADITCSLKLNKLLLLLLTRQHIVFVVLFVMLCWYITGEGQCHVVKDSRHGGDFWSFRNNCRSNQRPTDLCQQMIKLCTSQHADNNPWNL